MSVTLGLATSQLDPGGQAAFPDGYLETLVSAQPITVTDTTAFFALPYLTASGKVKLVVNISALSGGSSPTLTVNFYESVDGGATYNSAAALTSGSLNAVGVTFSSAASGPVYPQGRLGFTIGGTGTPTFTTSVYLAAWNR